MSNNSRDFLAGSVLFLLGTFFILPIMANLSLSGFSPGEQFIIILIFWTVMIWSASQILCTVAETLAEIARTIYTNEKVRILAKVVFNRCSQAIRHEIKHFRTEMRKRNSL